MEQNIQQWWKCNEFKGSSWILLKKCYVFGKWAEKLTLEWNIRIWWENDKNKETSWILITKVKLVVKQKNKDQKWLKEWVWKTDEKLTKKTGELLMKRDKWMDNGTTIRQINLRVTN